MRWKATKTFPALFPVDLDELTEEQETELYCHLQIDDGVRMCDGCHELGRGFYCSSCGIPYFEAKTECPKCETEFRSEVKYCSQCGTPIGLTDMEKMIINGTLDPKEIMKNIEPTSPEFIRKVFDEMKNSSDYLQIPAMERD